MVRDTKIADRLATFIGCVPLCLFVVVHEEGPVLRFTEDHKSMRVISLLHHLQTSHVRDTEHCIASKHGRE